MYELYYYRLYGTGVPWAASKLLQRSPGPLAPPLLSALRASSFGPSGLATEGP